MKNYENIMEIVIEERLDKMYDELGCCKCEMCRCDIICSALNQLPSKYYSTLQGEIYTKLSALKTQSTVDIVNALCVASQKVKNNPRHK